MAPKSTSVERVLAELAAEAHGVVTRKELLAAGVTHDEIKERVERGGLLPEYRGVYRVGHRAPSLEARYIAAVKASGDQAALSGRAAAFLYELIRGTAPRPEVTTRCKRRVAGVVTHRSEVVETTTHRGIPIVTVPHALIDLAASLPSPALARACHEADIRYGTTPEQVETALTRRPRHRGAGRLRRVLRDDEPVTLSRLESRFHDLLRDNGLPLPVMNKRVGRYRVDCRWERPPLTVELDGYRYHRSRHAWEQDRRREREARRRGDDFRRYTYADVFESPRAMLAELRAVISPAW